MLLEWRREDHSIQWQLTLHSGRLNFLHPLISGTAHLHQGLSNEVAQLGTQEAGQLGRSIHDMLVPAPRAC